MTTNNDVGFTQNKPKIRIQDDTELRQQIEHLVSKFSHVLLSHWALAVAIHVQPFLEAELPNDPHVINGIETLSKWQVGDATVGEVRQAAFKVHEIARHVNNSSAIAAARSLGQAIGVGHTSGHGMVASDYAIKAVELATAGDFNTITKERDWQLKRANELFQEN